MNRSGPTRHPGENTRRLALLSGSLLLLLLGGTACRRPEPPAAARPGLVRIQKPERQLDYLQVETIGRPPGPGQPWVANVTTADLDQDGRLDVLACESQTNEVLWLRQSAPGRFEEIVLTREFLAPVHVEVADMEADGDLDVLVSVMGYVFPNNDRIGQAVVLENDGHQQFTPHVVLDRTSRVTDLRAADLNGDGQLDLVAAQFGYDQGEVRWLERIGPWEFRPHVLLGLSGAINVGVADFTSDGRPDVVALISQQWEEVHLFENQGAGRFAGRRIWGSTNEDYGSSGLSVADLNADGRPDILYTNGDGFGPAAVPGPRPWHGVQWFENLGNGLFRYHRIGDLPGAYSPIAVDLDQDGAMDVLASSAYADWDPKQPLPVALMWYRNDGHQQFSPRILAYTPKDLISIAAGVFDPGGPPAIVSGSFHIAITPPDRTGRIQLWRRSR